MSQVNTKSFIVRTPEMVPDRSLNAARQGLGISDWFMAKTQTISGDYSYGIAAYYYEKKEWLVIQSGMERVIEYYVEISDEKTN